jgi:hypothetical protein
MFISMPAHRGQEGRSLGDPRGGSRLDVFLVELGIHFAEVQSRST